MEQRITIAEDDVFELLAFLATSARLCVDEPKLYGTFRLVDGASRLLSFVLKSDQMEDRQLLQRLRDEIDEKKFLLTTNREAYLKFLDDLTRKVARELKERAGTAP